MNHYNCPVLRQKSWLALLSFWVNYHKTIETFYRVFLTLTRSWFIKVWFSAKVYTFLTFPAKCLNWYLYWSSLWNRLNLQFYLSFFFFFFLKNNFWKPINRKISDGRNTKRLLFPLGYPKRLHLISENKNSLA